MSDVTLYETCVLQCNTYYKHVTTDRVSETRVRVDLYRKYRQKTANNESVLQMEGTVNAVQCQIDPTQQSQEAA